jgi:hypothetical protein
MDGRRLSSVIVCPLCEHVQAQGADCDVCGKKLLRGAAAIPAVPAVDGLEPTLHAVVEAGYERVPGLEPTRHEDVLTLEEPAPDVDHGRAARVDPAIELFPELERIGDDVPEDAPTRSPATVTCRYCRTPAAAGDRICGRCGMRLPAFAAGSGVDVGSAARRCGCGALVAGAVCPSCGARR